MLRVLLQALALAFLGAFNLYGASLIYFQELLLKKTGLLLLFTVVALLLQKLSRVASPQGPLILVLSLLLFVHAALSSLCIKGQQHLFAGLHQHQLATHPKTWRAMRNVGDFFFARLCPALGTVSQALLIFH
jgi:hypothetical protein